MYPFNMLYNFLQYCPVKVISLLFSKISRLLLNYLKGDYLSPAGYEYNGNGFEKKHKITGKGPVINVIQIHLHPIIKLDIMPVRYNLP